MLWVWGEPEGARSRPMRRCIVAEAPRRGRPSKILTIQEVSDAYQRYREKAAARTKKWREKKERG